MITETDIYEIEINEYSLIDGVVSFIDFGYGFVVKNRATDCILDKNFKWVPVEFFKGDDYVDTVFVDLPAAIDAYNKTLQ